MTKSSAPIRKLSPYAPKKLDSGSWQLRWRLYRADDTDQIRKASFPSKSQAQAFSENLRRAHLRQEGWSLSLSGDPIHETTSEADGPTAIEAITEYWEVHKLSWSASNRRNFKDAFRFLIAEVVPEIPTAAEAWLRTAFSMVDTDPDDVGRLELIEASIPMSEVDRKLVQRAVTASGSRCAVDTERRRWTYMLGFLKWSVEVGYLDKPINGVSVRSKAAGSEQVDPDDLPSDEEIAAFTEELVNVAGEKYRALPHVLDGAGLRIGEACALLRSDITVDEDTGGMWISVRKSESYSPPRHRENPDDITRGTKGRGPVGNTRGRATYLPAHRAEILQTHLDTYVGEGPNARVFTAARGGRLTMEFFGPKKWNVAAANVFPQPHRLHKMRRHLLRHAWATRLLNGGIPIPTVTQWGGWRNPGVLLKIYAGTMVDDNRLGAARVESMYDD